MIITPDSAMGVHDSDAQRLKQMLQVSAQEKVICNATMAFVEWVHNVWNVIQRGSHPR